MSTATRFSVDTANFAPALKGVVEAAGKDWASSIGGTLAW